MKTFKKQNALLYSWPLREILIWITSINKKLSATCFYINEQINVGSKKKLYSITTLSVKDRRLEKVFVPCPWTGDLDKNRLMRLGQPRLTSTAWLCQACVDAQCSSSVVRGREASQHNWALHTSWGELEFHEECFEGRFLTHTKPSTY